MTLNIWNYNDPWPRRRELIVDAVREVDPDVIGFQEIRHDGARDEDGRNQAEQLAARLPDYQIVIQPAQVDAGSDRWEGLAIFSRLPIASTDHVELSRDPSDSRDNHQRIVLHAEIDTSAGSLHVYDTHLSLSREGRRRTVREIAAFIDRNAAPAVLVGDFNEVPEEEAIHHIAEGAGFLDAWPALHPDDPGHTFSSDNPYTNADDSRRIDYVFLRQGDLAHLRACRRIADRPASDGHCPSDHYGLVVDLELTPRW
jgi:endonuclease/exonuclease/phosphatase family metal-dependent hydrolase